jgi:coenzyme F420 hydrogenase subunit beta
LSEPACRAAARPSALRFADATAIVDWRLCVGCGACVYACESGRLEMVDVVADGLRPGWVVPLAGGAAAVPACAGCTDCVDVCPGLGIAHAPVAEDGPFARELREGWGPVLEVWEGFALDDGLRHGGSSAGLASALALHAIEARGLAGIVHVGGVDGASHRNESVFSTSRAQLLARTGSRYSPASPCDRLGDIEQAGAPCVFIGKPCDVEGLRKAQAMRPRLDARVGLAIGIFCAGTPSTQGTLDLLARHGVDPAHVDELRYRGRGWPGTFSVRLRGGDTWRDLCTYAQAWDFLQAYRPYRCHLCPDSTSEFADVSCGDPWYRDTADHQPGLSLVLVRTEVGRAAVHAAIAGGRVHLVRVDPGALEQSQKELERKRGAIWGRLFALRTLGVPAPRFDGFALLRNWLGSSVWEKVRSVLGTWRRALRRGYRSARSSRIASVGEQE